MENKPTTLVKEFKPDRLSDLVFIDQIFKKLLPPSNKDFFDLLTPSEKWSVLKIQAFMEKKFEILDAMLAWQNQYKAKP